MNTWDRMQAEIAEWATHNFGENPIWQPMLGLIEEIGEFFAAISSSTAVNRPANLRDQWIDALGDQGVYVLCLCERAGIQFGADIAANEENTAQRLLDRELFGVMGLASRAILKHAQGIRNMTTGERHKHLLLALAMWFRWAQAQADNFGLPSVHDMVLSTWSEVQKRDWVKHPTNANLMAVIGD